MAIYVSKDGKTRVEIDESDRSMLNQYKALGYRPDKGEGSDENVAEPASEPSSPPQTSEGTK
jgi:hypothetical protein